MTGAGNTCDDITPEGCIFTKNLIVFDATPEEVSRQRSSHSGTCTLGRHVASVFAHLPVACSQIIAAVAGETAATPVAVETPAATEVVVEDAAEVAECPPTVTVTGSSLLSFRSTQD